MRDPILYHSDPNTPWIIETNTNKTAFIGILLQPHIHEGVRQEIPVIFITYNITGTQQAWSATECELYMIYVAMHKLSYMIKGGKVTIRTDNKPLLEIVAGTAKSQNTAAAEKFHCLTNEILAGDPHPTIEYKKGSLNLIVDSLLRLRTGEHYEHNTPLHNTEPIILKKKAEVDMATTHANSAELEKLTPNLLDLQIRVRDIFKTPDKCQLAQNIVAVDKFCHWTSDILAGDPHPTIEYKRTSLNLIADSLSRLRTGEHYEHNTPLHNTEPIILKKKAEVNMVTTHAKSAELEKLTLNLPDLQIRVRDILKHWINAS